jgi:hypothetical protein
MSYCCFLPKASTASPVHTCPEGVGLAQQSTVVLATLLLLLPAGCIGTAAAAAAAAAAVALAADVCVDFVDVDVALLSHGYVQPACSSSSNHQQSSSFIDSLACMFTRSFLQ